MQSASFSNADIKGKSESKLVSFTSFVRSEAQIRLNINLELHKCNQKTTFLFFNVNCLQFRESTKPITPFINDGIPNFDQSIENLNTL